MSESDQGYTCKFSRMLHFTQNRQCTIHVAVATPTERGRKAMQRNIRT